MSSSVKLATIMDDRLYYYQTLMAGSVESGNAVWLAQIIASWLTGEGVLSDRLGLTQTQFNCLKAVFPDEQLPEFAPSGNQLDFSRMLEKQDLEAYLGKFVQIKTAETELIIALLVAACLGNDHLWQDLGLWSRKDLSELLLHNFPKLAAANSADMKWKKFIYKQLCAAEGIYVCRAPSCEVCQDYPVCFGPED